MHNVHTYKNLTWIDIENPTRDEILQIMEQYHLSPQIAEELLSPTPRPKVDVHQDYIYLVLHFPRAGDHMGIETRDEQELDCIIGPEHLITVRYSPMEAVLEFGKQLDMAQMLDRDNMGDHGGFLLYHLISLFYQHIERSLNNMNETLKDIETRIFQGEENRMVHLISKINRRILDHKRALRFHSMTLGDLEISVGNIFESNFPYYIDRLIREYHEINTLMESNKQILDDLRDTNTLLLNTKTNRTTKMISIIVLLTVPVSIGLQFLKIPAEKIGATVPGAIIVIVAIVLVTLLLLWYFRYKKWI